MEATRTIASPPASTTRERILEAAIEVVGYLGLRRMSIAAVARGAGLSRPTVYRWFPSIAVLLQAVGPYEQAKFETGIAAALALVGESEQLDAALRYVVEFQRTCSLRRLVGVEPEHVLGQVDRFLPDTLGRLLPFFPGPDGPTTAAVAACVVVSHTLLPDDDPERFLAELRRAAGVA